MQEALVTMRGHETRHPSPGRIAPSHPEPCSACSAPLPGTPTASGSQDWAQSQQVQDNGHDFSPPYPEHSRTPPTETSFHQSRLGPHVCFGKCYACAQQCSSGATLERVLDQMHAQASRGAHAPRLQGG
eukprot:CAMPEP_0174299600 /NCGR_PEP_ID=MMETSP0809-20121228/57159_1 /TAXON_ID=73025 ORGANISM="Eutreptiella gymnastica-like, Strain CCMP1594" /NCGR_SAMPLE_ID=MMETSP0809 /ASSEMBLY_ACC=CAM_ASM_000658 /LENGTH=128 /DNA_ID=CAMNT_0015404897 /DNA_START=472 /DNA_END=858 /DNA_ORIENTATION=-